MKIFVQAYPWMICLPKYLHIFSYFIKLNTMTGSEQLGKLLQHYLAVFKKALNISRPSAATTAHISARCVIHLNFHIGSLSSYSMLHSSRSLSLVRSCSLSPSLSPSPSLSRSISFSRSILLLRSLALSLFLSLTLSCSLARSLPPSTALSPSHPLCPPPGRLQEGPEHLQALCRYYSSCSRLGVSFI